MPLEDGTRLGPYEILGPLGAGGMGEVYRAKDTRLDRTVAIKVLPEHMSSSPEIRQRFEREAKVISSLSHPHICTLHDVGQHEGIDFLVMEHLEGETLAQRLKQGPLPMEQVLELGGQIADALDKAHKGGVVHRDLKPGNIMLTAGGVKLLDFGLARHQLSESQVKSDSFSRALTETPSSAPLTVEGTILGTFQYMPPEQIEGAEATPRSDIFAFGAVLYEMATGRKAFEGKTQASLIGSVMHSKPEPVSKLVPLGPPAFDRVVETCLAKDPEDRFGTAHDVGLQLKWIAEGGSLVGLPAPVAARRKVRERLAWGLAATAAIAAVTFAILWARRAPEPPQVVRFQIPAPDGLPVIGSPRLSPDGRYVAFDARDAQGDRMLWLRPLNALEAHPLAGTEGAAFRPFWSPDSRYLGFIADGKLKKIPVSGGPPQVICDAPTGADGSWSEMGVILFDGQENDPLQRVPASGGLPTAQVPGEEQPGWPQFLPGGDKYLYVSITATQPEVRVASLEGGEARTVLTGLSRVEYAPPGYLLYVRENTLVAQPFDADAGTITGEPVPLAQDLGLDNVGLAHFSSSANGVLVFRSGEAGGARLVWVDRKGLTGETVGDPADIAATALSPDGRWLALSRTGESTESSDIWVRDLVRGVTSRFTFDEGRDIEPGVVAGRQPHRLGGGARRPARHRGQGGGRNGRGGDSAGSRGHPVPELLVSRREEPALLQPRPRDVVGRQCPAPRGRRDAPALHQDSLRRAALAVLAERALGRLRVERVRPLRDLRPGVPGAGRQVADLHRRRQRAPVEPRRQGAVLPLPGATDDARRRADRGRRSRRASRSRCSR